jgi:hypothetical protein
MDKYSHAQKLLMALKIVKKSQKAAAKAVQCKETTFFYRANYATNISIEFLTQVKVVLLKYRHLVPELTDEDLKIDDGVSKFLPISMQATLAKTLLKQPVKKPGRSAEQANEKKSIKCKNFYTFKERRAKKIAKQCGFRNHTTMYQAIKVIDKGCFELIAAMDKDVVKISVAALLASLSEELQQKLVRQGVDAIKAYLKEQKSKQPLKKLTTFEGVKSMGAHEQLKDLEIIYQLPLRKTLMGLSAQCDRKGEFIWDIAHLKTCLLLEEVPLEACVDMLCQHQMIEKKPVGKKLVGHILL